MHNTAYIFMPFAVADKAQQEQLIAALDAAPGWELVHDEIAYMLKYISDKLDATLPARCCCFHYALTPAGRAQAGLAAAQCWYETAPHEFAGAQECSRFQVEGMQLYCFRTGVGIVALRLHLEKDDPMWVSNTLYHLKKISRTQVRAVGQQSYGTLLEMARAAMAGVQPAGGLRFFYYVNPSHERANVLTFLPVAPKADYRRELFYLRRCYNENILYVEDAQLDEQEIYASSQDVVWGISPEAAVCLACPDLGRADFVRRTFYGNFNVQYLFMYVLLLHQKYVLYLFLTRIGVGMYNDLATLEEYRRQLYEFENDFVFSCVTEVPQYQNLYERMAQAFALKQMFADVHEPLVGLGEVRRAAAEEQQKRRDDNVDRALLLLSLLSFFSALVDGFDFTAEFFGWFLPPLWVHVAQAVCVAGIVAILIIVCGRLLRAGKRRRKK